MIYHWFYLRFFFLSFFLSSANCLLAIGNYHGNDIPASSFFIFSASASPVDHHLLPVLVDRVSIKKWKNRKNSFFFFSFHPTFPILLFPSSFHSNSGVPSGCEAQCGNDGSLWSIEAKRKGGGAHWKRIQQPDLRTRILENRIEIDACTGSSCHQRSACKWKATATIIYCIVPGKKSIGVSDVLSSFFARGYCINFFC